jgi:poly(3-hydroxybutyrate) depolymerase
MSAKMRPYGEWESPITSESLTTATVALSAVHLEESTVFWQEGRPTDGGRSALVAASWSDNGALQEVEVVPTATEDFSVQSRVHEYGGAAYTVVSELRAVFFVNLKDQRLWRVEESEDGSWGAPQPLTSEPTVDVSRRFADCVYDSAGHRLVAVRESHVKDVAEAVAEIVAVDVDSGSETVLASGMDFYASPRLSQDGKLLAFVGWSHPAMPWDASGVYLASLAQFSLEHLRCVSGGACYGNEDAASVMQPSFNGNDLYYISDVSGWWSVYKHVAEPGVPDELIFGGEGKEVGGPAWMFGAKSYQFLRTSSATYMLVQFSDISKPGAQACFVNLADVSATPTTVDLKPLMNVSGLRLLAITGRDGFFRIGCVGGSPTMHATVAVSELDLRDPSSPKLSAWTFVKTASATPLDENVLSVPRVIAFPTSDGSAVAYMNYYPPRNDGFVAPSDGSLPPLLIKSHGGPTSSASTAYSSRIQYFTSRGFAVADVNYSGSSGFGTLYRRRLNSNWGVADVEDCAQAALHLAEQGLADRKRIAISGGSAGGYTTLACLCWKNNVFSAGASLYGVADLTLLAKETHKFESRYLDSLVGPYPEKKALYESRSPVNSAHLFKTPLIQFQGLLDQVVPPSQARVMHEALKKNGVKSCLVEFPEERHGFRAKSSIRQSLDGELWFYSQVLGFDANLGNPDFVPPTIE